jgi:HEAT repeat protein/3',5'-cyclic AMP phosphodiesterase CpdA
MIINWSRYLESLCTTYAQWWQVYTITDVVGRKRVESEPLPLLFDFGLMVQTVERDREEKGKREEKVERFSVLEGLHKYAWEHVLLVGRPGSGKSTALVRLVLEEADRCRGAREASETWERTPLNPRLVRGEEDSSSLAPLLVRGEEDSSSLAPPLIRGAGGVKIPVLVELRYYRTSILDLIQDFLQRHDPNLTVDSETLKSWLRQGQLLLLVDGVNELPSEEARRDLHKFRQDYQKTTPMIFTTRDLGVGGDLDIAKKLEMQPLSEAQMQQFVRAYLPEQGEQMLRQLGSRLRELGQTPLLLWMLCSLFKTMGKVPPNLGLVFRQFAQSYYDKLKQDVPVSDESRRWCQLMLQHLAWRMTQGREAAELQVAISRHEAEEILTAYLRKEGFAQPRNCAMEWLADLLKYHLLQLGINNQIEFRHQLIQEHCTAETLMKLLPSLSDEELKREYLNYLKWTEPLALMLELVEDEAQAVRVVKLALEVDLRLGARLAGAVKPECQEQTVSLVAGLEIPQLLKIKLLGLTKSEIAILMLNKALEDEDSFVRWNAAEALGHIGSETAVPQLIQLLKDENFFVRMIATNVLGHIGSEAVRPQLVELRKDESSFVRASASDSLKRLNAKAGSSQSVQAQEDNNSSVPESVRDTLEQIDAGLTIPQLIQLLEDENYSVRRSAANSLGRIGAEAAVPQLIKLLEHENVFVQMSAADSLGRIGAEAAVPQLIKLLDKNQSGSVQTAVAKALGTINSEAIIPQLMPLLEHGDIQRHENIAVYYEKILVYTNAAEALAQITSEAAIPQLIQLLDNRLNLVRKYAADALGRMGAKGAISQLIKLLGDENCEVRESAIKALGKIGAEVAISELIKLLENVEDKDFLEANLPFQVPEDAEFNDWAAAEQDVRRLYYHATEALQTIQNRCKFYNPTLTQPIPIPELQPTIPPIQSISTSLMHILHLSDLHFGTLDQANLWSNQLAADLYNDLSIPQLDALILSGDIANYSTEEEYIAAEQFLHNLRQDFPLNPEQIILVPGNHDLNWKLAKKAYNLFDRDDYDGELFDGHYIEESASVIRVRDEEQYKQRFAHFSQFYEAIKQKPYPLGYDQQYTLDHLPEQNLLILGLNSAWQLDHHYKSRASIHMGALTQALTQIRRNPDYRNCLKIAVWHHPLDSAYSDRITDQGFLEQLAVNGFRFFLHGHIHKAETSLFRYDMSTNGRKLDRICAGTFGAPVREWVPGYPLQYNLLKLADNQLTVYTRRREELNGAWKPDARWGQGAGKTPLDYYAIQL